MYTYSTLRPETHARKEQNKESPNTAKGRRETEHIAAPTDTDEVKTTFRTMQLGGAENRKRGQRAGTRTRHSVKAMRNRMKRHIDEIQI